MYKFKLEFRNHFSNHKGRFGKAYIAMEESKLLPNLKLVSSWKVFVI